MFIKEIIIDGFKSYANRTVISGWDRSFNAITGLNGSGKSNILDSICFVLGISNLKQVRVSNLQELVYKQGQSRVTKASVTIVFDNRDRKTSPVGYEQYDELTITRQVVIGGRNKYLINGRTAQLNRVQNLFHSVGLNVNNPHFLIMQGRITKVCNMKPPEVLGMIEEAAGTRMYENKKVQAKRTIQKKQIKVAEINKILLEEITPQLEKLRKERSSYMQWSANSAEIERLDRLVVASEFCKAEEVIKQGNEGVQKLEEELEDLKDEVEQLQQAQQKKAAAIAKLVEAKEQQMESAYKELEAAVAEESKVLVQKTSVYKNKADDLKAQKKALKDVEKNIREVQANIAKKEKEIQAQKDAHHANAEKYEKLQNRVSTLQSQQLGISMSDNDSDQEKGSLANQLMQAQRSASMCASQAQGLAMKIQHSQKELKEKSKEAKRAEREHAKQQKELQTKKNRLDSLKKKLAATSFDEKEQQQLERQEAQLNQEVEALQEDADRLSAMLARLNFQFKSPSANFDRTKVKGLVAKLLELKDVKTATALEVTAGGRLYNVVVDTENTGKQLLSKGQLKRRVTIIPLNKIAARSLSQQVVRKAKEVVGADNAHLALTLVGYDKEVEAAMAYVFGRTFVCTSTAAARKVTFNKEIRVPSVTLQGDMFDPSGTLSGGSAPAGGSVLVKLERLNSLLKKLERHRATLSSIAKKLSDIKKSEALTRELRSAIEMEKHAIALLETRMGQSKYAQLNKQMESIRDTISASQQEEELVLSQEEEAKSRSTELEESLRDFEKARKQKMKDIENELARSKKELARLADGVENGKQAAEALNMELASLQEDLQQLQEQGAALEARISKLTDEAEALATEVATVEAKYSEAQSELAKEKKQLAAADQKISKLQSEKEKVAKQLQDNSLKQKKLHHSIQRSQNGQKDATAKVAAMLAKYEWVESQRHLFGKAHTDFDFAEHDPKKAAARLRKLRSEQDKLGRTINKKVMGMFERAEQEYAELMRKRDIIEKDKLKIEQVIEELDRKKNEALETTWVKVNRDLGSIFSTLLPGAKAKLEPPAGCTVLDGLELCVGFGDVWKESLSELSGGQRSLLALSLILALLLFKPAPMYILDEIDAALDLSHTQNIGSMLKTHFPQSQFIVVSLKEGMFNNANVIFRTKFVDGVSTVSRTQHRVPLGDAGSKSNKPIKAASKGKRRARKMR